MPRSRKPTEAERLTSIWTDDIQFTLRLRGFEIDRDTAGRAAREIAANILEGRREVEEFEERRRWRVAAQAAICAAVGLGLSKSEAAMRAGVSRESVRLWARSDPSFREALRTAEERGREVRRQRPPLRAPRRMKKGVRDSITTLLSEGMTRSEALAAAGISKQTFYTWLQRSPEFKRAVLDAENLRPSFG